MTTPINPPGWDAPGNIHYPTRETEDFIIEVQAVPVSENLLQRFARSLVDRIVEDCADPEFEKQCEMEAMNHV